MQRLLRRCGISVQVVDLVAAAKFQAKAELGNQALRRKTHREKCPLLSQCHALHQPKLVIE